MLVEQKMVLLNYPTKHLILRKRELLQNRRLQAQILHSENYRIIWLNCYFPTDPQTIQYNDEELSTVLEEIENILDNNVFDD